MSEPACSPFRMLPNDIPAQAIKALLDGSNLGRRSDYGLLVGQSASTSDDGASLSSSGEGPTVYVANGKPVAEGASVKDEDRAAKVAEKDAREAAKEARQEAKAAEKEARALTMAAQATPAAATGTRVATVRARTEPENLTLRNRRTCLHGRRCRALILPPTEPAHTLGSLGRNT
jgi:hypothetical protein